MNPRTLTAALLAAALLPAAPVTADPAPASSRTEEVYLVDPGLPGDLEHELRVHLLDELVEGLESAFGERLRVRQSPSAATLVIRSDAAVRKGAVSLVEDLRTRMVDHLDSLRDMLLPEDRRGFGGEPLELRIQVALASREVSREHPLPPKLATALGEMLGFRSFRVVGQAAAKALVNETTEIQTQVPLDRDARLLAVSMSLTPHTRGAEGAVRIKAAFQIKQIEGPEDAPEIRTGLQTTYRPRAGVPLVIGASPLSAAESLVFLVTHEGEALE